MQRENSTEMQRGFLRILNIDPDKNMSILPEAGERIIQRVKRNNAQHSHMIGNSTFSTSQIGKIHYPWALGRILRRVLL